MQFVSNSLFEFYVISFMGYNLIDLYVYFVDTIFLTQNINRIISDKIRQLDKTSYQPIILRKKLQCISLRWPKLS